MSSTKHKPQLPPWWNYVKCIIREYPKLKRESEKLRMPSMVASYDANGGGKSNAISRPTERAVIHDLQWFKQRKLDAIEEALFELKKKPDGELRAKVIELMYFKKTHTVDGAALFIGRGRATVIRWQADFIREVAARLELP